jgi:opacity protein-like surface antigen
MPVRKYLLAAAAAAAIATPAVARDHSGYIGIDAGAMWSKSNLHLDATDSYYCDYFDYYFSTCSTSLSSKNKIGYDVDVVGGYDFGMFRLEGELAYKHARQKDRTFGDSASGLVDVSGKTTNWSAMINGLVDLGSDDSINFSLGGGVGWARTKYSFDVNTVTAGDGDYYFDNFGTSVSKSKFAWQLLAEARTRSRRRSMSA